MISVCVVDTDQLWQLVLALQMTVLAKMKSIARYLTFKEKKKREKAPHRIKCLMYREWDIFVKSEQSLLTASAATLAEVGGCHSCVQSDARAAGTQREKEQAQAQFRTRGQSSIQTGVHL